MDLALGVDLGGTKIEIIGLDAAGNVRLRRRRPSPRGSYRGTLEAIQDLVLGAEAELGGRGTVGFGTPGAISPATGLLKNSNSTWLNGHPLDRDLAAILERPIAIANDADCFAQAEAIAPFSRWPVGVGISRGIPAVARTGPCSKHRCRGRRDAAQTVHGAGRPDPFAWPKDHRSDHAPARCVRQPSATAGLRSGSVRGGGFMASESRITVMSNSLGQLSKLGSKFIDLQAIEPVVAMRCLNCAAIFVQMARSLDAFHLLLYWLCVLVAVATATIGLGAVGGYALRTIAARRLTRAGDQPTPDEAPPAVR